jgi:hypothetical protein
MVVDPMSALSVAATAVQFVDFSRILVCKSKDLYRSMDGVLPENRGTETIAMRLKEMAEALQTQSVQASQFVGYTTSRLQTLCNECDVISTRLLDRLRLLRVPDNARCRTWKSFRQALKSVCSKHEIDDLAKMLSSLRDELDTEVLILLK